MQCKLCMKILHNYSNEFDVLEGILKDMLVVVLLKQNFTENDNPVICKTCKENLHKSFDFKANCIYTEDCLYPYMNSLDGDKVDLKVVYFRERTIDETFKFDENTEICRFCLSLTNGNTAVALKCEILKYGQFIGNYMPELNLEATDKAIICRCCSISLEQYVTFVKFYLNNESKIIERGHTDAFQNNESKTNLAKLSRPIEISDDKVIIKELVLAENLLPNLDSITVKTEEDICDENRSELMKETNEKLNRNIEYFLPISKLNSDPIKIEEIEIKSDQSTTLDGGINVSEQMENDYVTQEGRRFKIESVDTQPDTKHKNFPEASDTNMYKYKICNQETKFISNIKSQVEINNDVSEIKLFECDICTFTTKKNCYLKRHRKIHEKTSKMRMYKCEICDWESKWKSSLKIHMSNHHNVSDIRIFKCEICKYETKRKGHYRMHMLIHGKPSEINMFECEFCSYKAKQKSHVNAHMRVHKISAIKMFKCGECNLETKWKSCLNRHLLIHNKNSLQRHSKP